MPKNGFVTITVTELVYKKLEETRRKLGEKSPSKTLEKILGVDEIDL